MTNNNEIKLTKDPLDVTQCLAQVDRLDCGGLDIFVGKVRNNTKGRVVQRLEFEAYEPMALKEMQKIAQSAKTQWPIHAMAIHHRIGTLYPGDIAVLIAVSAPHRDAAFDACRYAINTLKQTVPIWKKEIFEDGEVWVSAHP